MCAGDTKILDLGCGACKTPGAIGIDFRPYPGVDVVCDLNVFPWPFEDDTFDEIISTGVIEMLDSVIDTMDELHRIAKPGGVLKITTPHCSAYNAYWDPAQKWRFSLVTFNYFCENWVNPVYTVRKWRMVKQELQFTRKWGLGSIMYRLSPRRYEKYYAHRYPAHMMYIEMATIK